MLVGDDVFVVEINLVKNELHKYSDVIVVVTNIKIKLMAALLKGTVISMVSLSLASSLVLHWWYRRR